MIEYYKNLDLADIVYTNEFGMKCTEIWKDIPNYEGIYQASDLGRIKSISRIAIRSNVGNYFKKSIILKQSFFNKNRYAHVCLYGLNNKKHTVHQLVAMTFLGHIPCGYNFVIDHKNNISYDNRLENLQIVTTRVNTTKEKKKGKSKYIGLTWDKKAMKWQSAIVINKKNVYLGYFNEELLASKTYQIALENIDKYDGDNAKFRSLIKSLLRI